MDVAASTDITRRNERRGWKCEEFMGEPHRAADYCRVSLMMLPK